MHKRSLTTYINPQTHKYFYVKYPYSTYICNALNLISYIYLQYVVGL